MRALIKNLLTIIAIVVIVSCNSQETNSRTVPESPQIITEKSDTQQPTFQSEVVATPTPSPILTTTVSQDQLLRSEDLPPWMSDETISKFIIQFGSIIDGYRSLGIINASTGESFILHIDNILGYFWLHDNRNLGVLLDSRKDVLLVNVQTGEKSLVELNDNAVEFTYFGNPPNSLIANNNPIENQDFRLFNSFSKISDDGKYLIDDDYDSTSVIDLNSGEVIAVTSQDDGVYDLDSAWVPNTNHLSIVHSDFRPGPGYFFEIGIEPNIRLNILDIHSGEIIKTITNVPKVNWSPEGKFLLYQPFLEAGITLFESAPCLLNIDTNQTICLNELAIPEVDELPDPVRYHELSWSPSGELFSFTYYSKKGSGLCLVEVETQNVKCMLADLYESGYYVAHTAWSPDEKYIDFQFGQYYPFSDADFPPFHGVLDIRSGEYIELGETISMSSWKP